VTVAQMAKGGECGIALEGFAGVQAGDVIECLEVVQRRRTLDEPPPKQQLSVPASR